MASRFILPFADVGDGITPSDGALLEFFITGTETPKDTFSDEALTTPNTNPVVADGNGVFSDIWMPDGARYKVTLDDKNIVQKFEADPVVSPDAIAPASLTARTFDTVALMAASTLLNVGEIVDTAGYTSKGDGGDNRYEIVGAGTGTVDGGSFINLSTHQAKGLFPRGFVIYDQFGAIGGGVTNDRVAIQAAHDYDQGVRGREVRGLAGKTYGVTGNININGANTQFGMTLIGGGLNATLITVLSGFTGTGDTNCIFLLDGTSMTNHRKSFKDISISDNANLAPSGFEAVKLVNGAFENDFTRVWFATSNTHISVDADSLGPLVENCVFDNATNSSVIDLSYKPGKYIGCIFVSITTSLPDINMKYVASSHSGFSKSFGGEIDGCLFLNPFRAIEFNENQGLQIGSGNKFQCTSADADRFVQGLNSTGVSIKGTYFRQLGGAGNITGECMTLDNVNSSKVDVIFNNINGDGVILVDCDGTDVHVVADLVTGNSIRYSGAQTRGGSVSGVFRNCGTTSTHNVIQCTAGSQTSIIIDDCIFDATVGDFDIEASNTVYLFDNVYSAGVKETSFTGINRATDIFPSASTADLIDISNPINTDFKRLGKMVYSSGVNKPVWADGPTAGAVWVNATGATQHTPV